MSKIPKVLLLLESSREYGRQLIFGITEYTYFHGPWTFHREPGGRDKKIPDLSNLGVDGIIAHVNNEAIAEKIMDSGIPAITKGIMLPGLASIQTDNRQIGKSGAKHLIERGFRNFAFCGYNKVYWSDERQKSFKNCVEEKGGNFYLFNQARSKTWNKKQQELIEWLISLPKPTGLMTCVDDLSQEVLQACKNAEIDVPTDVAIVGVDNDPLVCRLTRPQLSSVSLGAEKAGYETAELLDKLMAGQKVDYQTITTEVTHVEVRQSTDILAMEDRKVALAIHFIKQNLNKLITVEDVVDATLIPRRTLQLCFKKEIGRTITDEIRRLKSDQVAEMLVTTNLPISKIALDLGYPGIDHVARSFRREKGISPIEYRKRHGHK